MTILQVCAYGADYAGNFIASLQTLETALSKHGHHTIYAFCEKAADKDWCKQICQRTKVYFLPEAKARILPQTYHIFHKIYKENHVDIIHSHFELYDIPATVTAPKQAKIFWHLHDPVTFGTGLRGLLWKIQYGIIGKRANLLSVADFYRQAVIDKGFPALQTQTILNSINLERIGDHRSRLNCRYDFLTFGWDFYRKGDDLILKACDRLEAEGYQFRLLLNGNEHTWPVLKEYFQGRKPAYLECGNPVLDVNALFDNSCVFIQASRRETFSYAVCEAAYAGLPVISSDIAGLEWAHSIPTVSFFQSENWIELYQKMKQALDGTFPDTFDIEQARQIIQEKHSLEAWADQVIACYRK